MKLIFPLFLLLLLLAGFFLYQESQTTTNSSAGPATTTDTSRPDSEADAALNDEDNVPPTEEEITGTSSDPSTAREPSGVEHEFTIEASNYEFSETEIRVDRGDMVTINFSSVEGTHDFVIDEFDISAPVLDAGETVPVTFIADETGSFEYYCSVGNHRAEGMTGTLIVE